MLDGLGALVGDAMSEKYDPAKAAESRWANLTDEQWQGAHFALRLVRTSPRIRGAALEMLDGLIDECEAERARRVQGREEDAA